MLRYICFLLLLLVSTINCWLTCEQTFCRRFRNRTLNDDEIFHADIANYKISNNMVRVPLANRKSDNLVLQIAILRFSKVRLTIKEPNNPRFMLKAGWSLEEEPVPQEFHIKTTDSSLIVSNKDVTYSVIILQGPPFSISLTLNNRQEIVLTGDNLVMENTNDAQAFGFKVDFKGTEKLYGLFDHSYQLALGETADGREDPFRLKNCEASGSNPYPADSTWSLYGAVPAVYGHSADITSGVFLHNAAEQWIDISYTGEQPSAHFMAEGGTLDLFVLLGPNPPDVVRQFTDLTGRAVLPQLWTLGYHQCRQSYHSQEDVKETAALMQEYRIPMDTIWLARDYSDGNRWFKWNQSSFSDPVEMQWNLSSINKKTVPITDPHFKVEDVYDVYAGAKGKYFVRNPDGSDFVGIAWPGNVSYIDYFYPPAAKYYSSWYHYDKWLFTTSTLGGVWNDLNEPSVFNGPEATAPYNAVFRVDENGGEVIHRDVHNIYGLMHVRSTYQGLLERDSYTVRPFILTRSHFAGSQRYAAMWTGDNSDTWRHFANSYSMCMTGNLLGMVNCGPDIGGFFGNTSFELAQRWFQAGAWFPFYRAHSSELYVRREPYLYPEEVRDVLRTAIEQRYRHLPYIYTVFYEHTRTGHPVVSPLFYRYPGIQERDSQMLVGRDIMSVAVVEESVSSVKVYFPGREDDWWYRIDNGTLVTYTPGEKDVEVDIKSSPVFYRSGSIIPIREEVKLSTGDYTVYDPYTLILALDKNNKSEGNFYMDDFTSFDYRKGHYYYMNIKADMGSMSLDMKFIDGNPIGFTPPLDAIDIFHWEKSETGIYKAERRRYTHTREGRLLRSINFGQEIRSSKNGKFIVYL